jgi:hypothetical protein
MADLAPATGRELERVLAAMLDSKLIKYAAESEYKPFFESLFTKEAIITASIVHSFYTSFGMSLYEQMAVILAKARGWHAERQYVVYGSIDPGTEALIHTICARTSKPDKLTEIEEIRRSIKPGKPDKDKESIADVFVRRDDKSEVLVDITTTKGNLKEYRALRRKLLRWCALRFSQDREVHLSTYIGMPYNPYHPQPYERWTAGECDPVHLNSTRRVAVV